MFTSDILHRLRINLRSMLSYMLSLLFDPMQNWEANMESNLGCASTSDLTRTLAELQLVFWHSNRFIQQVNRACLLLHSELLHRQVFTPPNTYFTPPIVISNNQYKAEVISVGMFILSYQASSELSPDFLFIYLIFYLRSCKALSLVQRKNHRYWF